jgi:hypothetical protein
MYVELIQLLNKTVGHGFSPTISSYSDCGLKPRPTVKIMTKNYFILLYNQSKAFFSNENNLGKNSRRIVLPIKASVFKPNLVMNFNVRWQ